MVGRSQKSAGLMSCVGIVLTVALLLRAAQASAEPSVYRVSRPHFNFPRAFGFRFPGLYQCAIQHRCPVRLGPVICNLATIPVTMVDIKLGCWAQALKCRHMLMTQSCGSQLSAFAVQCVTGP